MLATARTQSKEKYRIPDVHKVYSYKGKDLGHSSPSKRSVDKRIMSYAHAAGLFFPKSISTAVHKQNNSLGSHLEHQLTYEAKQHLQSKVKMSTAHSQGTLQTTFQGMKRKPKVICQGIAQDPLASLSC